MRYKGLNIEELMPTSFIFYKHYLLSRNDVVFSLDLFNKDEFAISKTFLRQLIKEIVDVVFGTF